jgi:hypothetical protein
MAMKKTIIAIGVLATFAWTAPAALAAGLGIGANANVNAGVSARTGGGPSVSATENSNGRFAADRDFGRDRAEDRMSAEGKAHSQASVAAQKKRHRNPENAPRANAAFSGSTSAEIEANRR